MTLSFFLVFPSGCQEMGTPNPLLITSKLPTQLGMPGTPLLFLHQGIFPPLLSSQLLCYSVLGPDRGNGKRLAWGANQLLEPLLLKRMNSDREAGLGDQLSHLRWGCLHCFTRLHWKAGRSTGGGGERWGGGADLPSMVVALWTLPFYTRPYIHLFCICPLLSCVKYSSTLQGLFEGI